MTDLYRGELSYRELWVLVYRLPPESLTQTVLRDNPPGGLRPPDQEQKFGPWSLVNWQLAELIDAVNHDRWTLLRVNGNDVPPPDPTPRPLDKRPKRVQSENNVRYLNDLRARG